MPQQRNGWPGHPGLDPLSTLYAQFIDHREEMGIWMRRQDHMLERIEDRLAHGTQVHHEMDKQLALHRADLTAHAARVAALETKDKPKDDKPLWKALPTREALILGALAISGLLGVMTPEEVKSAAKVVLHAASGIKP